MVKAVKTAALTLDTALEIFHLITHRTGCCKRHHHHDLNGVELTNVELTNDSFICVPFFTKRDNYAHDYTAVMRAAMALNY